MGPAKVCVMCGGKLKQATKGPGRRYCSGRCRIRAWRIRKETGELIKELTR